MPRPAIVEEEVADAAHQHAATGHVHHTRYGYDARNRLDTITVLLCASGADPCPTGDIVAGSQRTIDDYGYDENDNRTQVAEDDGSGTVTRTYGYDGRQQLIADSSAGTGCGNGQAYGYDDAGNRTCAAGRTFTYAADGTGQLDACSGVDCDPGYDADGRTTRLVTASGTWTYGYDAEGRLVSACNAPSCTGSGFARLDMAYDAEGHRVTLTETPAAGTATVTAFAYAGDAVVRETSVTGAATVTRTFTLDEAGAIVKMAVAGMGLHDDGDYLVTWNGHGDALELWRRNADGTLTLANSYTYSTWGTPTTTTHNGFADIGFRFLYVGSADVQWDNAFGLGLYNMHARHYSPRLGRFLQPDPSAAEANLYGYAGNGPVSRIDPKGTYAQTTQLEAQYCSRSVNLAACYAAYEWAQWAKRRRVSLFGHGKDGDRGNAFQHCAWASGCALELGASRARTITSNHENWTGSRFVDGPLSRRELAFRVMDLHNNGVGIWLVKRYNGYFQSNWSLAGARRAAEGDCLGAFRSGSLWWLYPNAYSGRHK